MSKSTVIILHKGDLHAQIVYPGPASPDTVDDLRVQCQRAFDHLLDITGVKPEAEEPEIETVTEPD